MKFLWTSILTAALVAGCASEGGVTGTGISAIVAGNVTIMEDRPVRVRIAEADFETQTDRAGNFELRGDFGGRLTLQFADARDGVGIGDIVIDVPPGSTTVLEGIAIEPGAPDPVRPSVVRQGSVLGVIADLVCGVGADERVTLDLEGGGGRFDVLLPADALIRARNGRALSCADLRRGDRVEAVGVQLSDGTNVAFSVLRTDRPVAVVDRFDVEFGGSVNDVRCDQDGIQVLVLSEGDPFLANVRGRAETELVCVDGDSFVPCECEDISPRDVVQVRGVVSAGRPEAVQARSIVVLSGPLVVDLPVVALRLGCERGLIEAEAQFETTSQVLIARLADDAEIICGGRPCACTDLEPGDVLRLVGGPVVQSGRPFFITGAVFRGRP